MPAPDIYLGQQGSEAVIPAGGRTFQEFTTELSREERTASGKLVRDVIASKKRFRLQYSLIDHTDLQTFETLYDLHSELRIIVHYTNTSSTTYTVLMRPIDKTRVLAVSPYCWGNVTIELEEV